MDMSKEDLLILAATTLIGVACGIWCTYLWLMKQVLPFQ